MNIILIFILLITAANCEEQYRVRFQHQVINRAFDIAEVRINNFSPTLENPLVFHWFIVTFNNTYVEEAMIQSCYADNDTDINHCQRQRKRINSYIMQGYTAKYTTDNSSSSNLRKFTVLYLAKNDSLTNASKILCGFSVGENLFPQTFRAQPTQLTYSNTFASGISYSVDAFNFALIFLNLQASGSPSTYTYTVLCIKPKGIKINYIRYMDCYRNEKDNSYCQEVIEEFDEISIQESKTKLFKFESSYSFEQKGFISLYIGFKDENLIESIYAGIRMNPLYQPNNLSLDSNYY